MRDETLHLAIEPHPNRPTLAPRVDFLIEGPIGQPRVTPESKLRAGASFVLDALLAPLSGLLPLIDGVGANSDCAKLIRREPAR